MAIAFESGIFVSAQGALVVSAQLVTTNNISAGVTVHTAATGSKSVSSCVVSGLSATFAVEGLVAGTNLRCTNHYRQANTATSTSNIRVALNGGGGGVDIGFCVMSFTRVGSTNMLRAASFSTTSTVTLVLSLACGSGDMAVAFGVGPNSATAGVAWTTFTAAEMNVAAWDLGFFYQSSSGQASIALTLVAANAPLLGALLILSATALGSAAPSTGFVGGLALMGCGLRIRWLIDEIIPPSLIPDAV